MNKEFLNSVITLDNNQKWYITDETEQGNDKFYLAVKLDENNNPDAESKIFKEVKANGKVFLDDQIDAETYQYLSAIFITNYSNKSDEIADGIKNEEVE